MTATMDVEALVAQMTENLAAIHTTIAGLSTKEHDARLDELEEKRDALLDALLSEYEAELEELTAQRAKEEEEIAETRRREDEEREARRKQEDEELLARKEAQDAERRDRLAQETGLVEEEADEGIDSVEAEVQKLLDEGQAKILELEEKRKEINRLIDERMSNPLPTFVPRKRARTRAADATPADAPPADAAGDAAPAADAAEAKKDAPAEDAPADGAKSEEAKSEAPAALLAIEDAPNADALKDDDDADDKDASTADGATTSKDEVSFHSPDPAGDDSGNDVKANEDASAPASDEAGAERGSEEAGEPATRGVDVSADDNVADANESSAEGVETKKTVEGDDTEVPAGDKPAEDESPRQASAAPNDDPAPNETLDLDEEAETNEEIKDQSIKGLSEDSTDTPAATGAATEDAAAASDEEELKEDPSNESPAEPDSTEVKDSDKDDVDAVVDSAETPEATEETQARSASPADDSAEKSAADAVQEVDAAAESPAPDTKVDDDDQLQSKSVDAASDDESADAKSVPDDTPPTEVEAKTDEAVEDKTGAEPVDTSADVPEEDVEPAVDYYHTRSPEPETRDNADDEPAKETVSTDGAEDKAAPAAKDASELDSAAVDGTETPALEDLGISVAAVAEEKGHADEEIEPSTPAEANEAQQLAEDEPVAAEKEEGFESEGLSISAIVDDQNQAEEVEGRSIPDEALKSPATVIEESNDAVDAVSTSAIDVSEDKDKSTSLEEDNSTVETVEPRLNEGAPSPSVTTIDKTIEEVGHDDKISISALDSDIVPAGPISEEKTEDVDAPQEQSDPLGSTSLEQQTDVPSARESSEPIELNESLLQSDDSVKPTKSESGHDTTVIPAESAASQPVQQAESQSNDPRVVSSEPPAEQSAPVVDLDEPLASNDFDLAKPAVETEVTAEPAESEPGKPVASVEPAESDVVVESAQPTESTRSLTATHANDTPESLETVSSVDPVMTDEPAKSTKAADLTGELVEPQVVIDSAATDSGSTTKESQELEHASDSINERSISSEPLSSSPDEESFLEIPEDTALDDEADRQPEESPGIKRASSSIGGGDQRPPSPDSEPTAPIAGDVSREEQSLPFDEPSSPLVDPDTPIPSIERDYDPSSDDEADDFEADTKYERQRSYALPEETPEPIEATTRSPAPDTATTPSVEPFIRDSDDYDDESRVEELLSAVRPQDASVELKSEERSVLSSMDARSSPLEQRDILSARDLSPADSSVDKSSIPDYYNTRSRSPSRFSEKPNADISLDTDCEDSITIAKSANEGPASPVGPEYIEDTAVKSFRDQVDEPQPQPAKGQTEGTRPSTEADDIVTVPLKAGDDALAEDPAMAYDDWDASPDASINGDSRFASTKTPWDAAHTEHESDDMAAARMGLSDDEDEFHLESTPLRSETTQRTYALPSLSPVKRNYDLPSFSRAAEPAPVEDHDSRESSEQPSVLDLYHTDGPDDNPLRENSREDGFQRDWSSLRAATSFHSSSAAESRESLPSFSRGALATTHIERAPPLRPWPETQTESTNWQFPEEDEESDRYRDFRANLPTTSDMNPAESTVMTNVRGQETLLDEDEYSTDASDYDSEAEAEAQMAAMKRSVTSPTEQFDGYVREQTIRVVDEPDGGPKTSEMTPRATQPTPLLLPRSKTRDAEPSPLALRYSQSYSPTRGLAYSKHNPNRPRTPPTVKSPAEPDFDPADFMPKDVTNVPWHARNDSAPISLRSQSTLDTADSSPVHSALHIDRHEPTIRDSWPQRPRNDSSFTDRGGDEYDPFRTDSGAKFPRQTYVPPVHNQSPQRSSMSSVAPGGNNVGSPGSLFHKMRSVFEKPGAAPPQQGGTTEAGSPVKSRPVSGVWHPVKPARPLSDLPDDNGITGYKRHVGLFNERAEDRDEHSALLRTTRSSYDGSGY